MYAIVDRFAQWVMTPPNPVVSTGHAGARKPTSASDLPAVVIAVDITDQRTTGLGRVMRFGELVTRTSTVATVAAAPGPFSSDRRRLQLTSLPLKKNPASLANTFTGDDVTVTNVTDAARPVTYRFVTQPTQADEFTIDGTQALLLFGAAQNTGDTLDIVHWTVTWREDIQGAAYRGLLNLEIWAATFEDAAAAAKALQDRALDRPDLLRQAGFSRLHGAGLSAAEQVLESPAVGSAFRAWRQPLAYRFAFEVERPAEDSSGGPIRRIDVNIEGSVEDALHVPRPVS